MNTIRVASYLLKINTGGEECRKSICCFSSDLLHYFIIDLDGS